jgi:preprotein translocase subunit SecE
VVHADPRGSASAWEPMSTQRMLLLAYIVLGVLVGLTLEQLLGGVFSSVTALGFFNHSLFGFEGWSYGTLVSYALAGGLALFCWRDPRVKGPATQVVEEMARVSWPTMAETRAATLAVILATLICAAMLGVFDYGWGMITETVYKP